MSELLRSGEEFGFGIFSVESLIQYICYKIYGRLDATEGKF